jgi:hypothetical protein
VYLTINFAFLANPFFFDADQWSKQCHFEMDRPGNSFLNQSYPWLQKLTGASECDLGLGANCEVGDSGGKWRSLRTGTRWEPFMEQGEMEFSLIVVAIAQSGQ